jgi:hypothetical protein
MYVQDIPVPHEDGSFVSEKISRIVELIREYDPKLDVRWVPPAARTRGEDAFQVVELCKDGVWRTAFTVKTEDEFNELVLARIYDADQRKHGNVMARLEAMQKAQDALKRKRWEDEMEQAGDMAQFLIKTPFHRVQLSKNRHINL